MTEKAATTLGVSQASPADGDNRSPQPELWWDNKGGAALQMMEWQRLFAAVRTPSGLKLIPDTDMRLHTSVVATFANDTGTYRWRIWSVSRGGMVVLSPWRTLNILPQ